MLKGIFLGALGAVAAGLAGFYLLAARGLIPANADAKPPALEKWIAKKALHAAIDRQAPTGANPVALNDANLIEGIKLYAADCAVCHGAADAQASHIARGLYQKAPQLGRYGVEDDEEGETYWKVYHGIRMTGMPAFRQTLSEEQIWKLVLFLKNMDALPPAAQKVWKAVPSAAAAQEQKVDFKKDVQPILKDSCLKCHSLDPKKPKKNGAGELRLDEAKLAMKGGRSGKAIVPGSAKDSLLYKLLSGPVPRPAPEEDEKDIPPMPKAKKGEKWKQLPAAQIDVIRRWIDQGAQWAD